MLAAALVGAACSSTGEPTASPAEVGSTLIRDVPEASGSADGGGTAPGEGETVDWSPCEELQCGTVEVPVEYSEPDGETISIAVNVHRATSAGKRIGHLLVNPGGPGVSGVDYVASNVRDGGFTAEVLEHFDIVGFDPRGVGSSEPTFACGAPGEYYDYLRSIDGLVDTDEEVAAAEAGAALCATSMGGAGPHLHTDHVARDMDEIRKALGAEQISYLGFSYGSFLGVWYATLFPDSVRAMVVDGAADPTVPQSQEARIAEELDQLAPLEQKLSEALAACDGAWCPMYNDDDPVCLLSAGDHEAVPRQRSGRRSPLCR